MQATGIGVVAVLGGCTGPGETLDGGVGNDGGPRSDANLDANSDAPGADAGVPLPRCGIHGAAYPVEATLIPWEDQINAQRYLDEDAALPEPRGCRLEPGRNYVRINHTIPGPKTGFMPPVTLRSGNHLFGFRNSVPMITIAAGAECVSVTHVAGPITFEAGRADQITRDIFLMGVRYADFQLIGARLQDSLFVDLYNGTITVDCSASGFMRNCRFVRAQSQGGSHVILVRGNAAEPSSGNVVLGLNALTMGNQPAGTDVGRFHFEGVPDVTLLNLGAENYEGRAWPITRVLGAEDVKIFGGFSFTQGLALLDTNAARTWSSAVSLVTQSGDSAYQNVLLRPGARSLVRTETVTDAQVTDMEPSPRLRALMFDDSSGDDPGPSWHANVVEIDGASRPATLTAAQGEEILACVSNRDGTPWPRPSLAPPPSDFSGLPMMTTPGMWDAEYIQQLLDTQPAVVLPPGIYTLDRPLKMGWVWTDLTTPGLESFTRGHIRMLIGSGKGRTVLRAASSGINLIESAHTAFNNDPMASFSHGGPQSLCMSDLTLQGGRWGIYLTSITGTDGVTLSQQYFDQTFSHICLRDMAEGGVFLDGIYAWDNCASAYVDFVNCPIGFQSIGRPGIDSTPDICYMDKCLFYGCQWRDCGQGFRLSAGRQCNSNYFVDCIFESITESAIRAQIVGMTIANCDFIHNGGAPTVLNLGSTWVVSSNFTTNRSDAVAFVDGMGGLSFEGCSFTRGPASNVVMVRETTGYGDPLNWQDSVNPGNRGPYVGRHIHYYNSVIGVPLGQWMNGVAIESDFQHPSDAALRARVIWTETTVTGAFEPWPVTADHIARHVLVPGTPMPRPQLLITR